MAAHRSVPFHGNRFTSALEADDDLVSLEAQRPVGRQVDRKTGCRERPAHGERGR